MADQQDTPKKGWLQKGNRKMVAIAVGTVVAVGSVFGVQAVANSKTGAHLMVLASDGGSWHGHRRGRFFDMTDAEIEKRIDRIVKHVAIEIDATPDQQARITKLFVEVAKEVKPIRGEMRASGRRMRELLVADKIDREALERIRAARLADAERISKSVVNAISDAAEVLSADQRRLLEKRVEEFRSMRQRWHGRWHRG